MPLPSQFVQCASRPPRFARSRHAPRHFARADAFCGANREPVNPGGSPRAFKEAIANVDAVPLITPEACIQFKPGLIAADGEVTNDSTRELLRRCMEDLHGFIASVCLDLPGNA
jgi:hypothetical protein